MKHLTIAVAAILLVGLIIAPDAHAQLGGGGGGYVAQLIQWFTTNIAQGLIMGAVLFCGVLLMFGHHTMAGVAVIIVGALVMSHYQELAGLINVG